MPDIGLLVGFSVAVLVVTAVVLKVLDEGDPWDDTED